MQIGGLGMKYEMTIEGPPRTKGNSPVAVARGTRVLVLPSKNYRKWFKAAMAQLPLLVQQSGIREPLTGRVNVTAIWFRDRNSGDEDNFKKGLGDFLQKAGFVANDRQIHWAGECRLDKDSERPRVEIVIEEAA